MSQSEVVVPPVTPVAATPPVSPPATPAAVVPAPAAAAVTPPATVTVTPIVHAAKPALATDDSQTDPAWLEKRLARERAKAIADAGFATVEEAKAAAADRKAKEEAEKATLTKLTERDAELAKVKTRAEQLEASTKEYAARMMLPLTNAQKAAVTAVAGEDATAQIRAITALTPTWAKEAAAVDAAAPAAPAAAATPAAAVVPAAVPATPAADTAPGRTQPAAGDTTPPNHSATYQSLLKSNPFAAAAYGREHPEAYKTA